MKANSEKTKQRNKATHRVLAGVLCGASVLSLVLSLVMPPISQAIANDAQAVSTEKTVMGGGSSSESTDVDDTTNGDTENQNSDDAEGDETGDDAQPEGQSEEEQQNEGTTTSDGETVAAVAENEQTKAAAEEITSTEELCSKLEGVQEGKSASFMLMQNIECNSEIFLSKNKSNITLDLNGCKIKHSGDNTKPLFSVSGGAEFTITDSDPDDKVTGTQQLQNQGQDLVRENVRENYGKNGKVDPDKDGIPTKLTYYVTKSSASGTDTTELLETHEVNIKGAIVSTASTGSKLKLINVYNHGKFNLQGGTLTQKEGCGVGNLIYAENGSTVNMSGGYVCGASGSGVGAGIMVSNEQGGASTLKLTGGVIAGNSAYSGGGVYARYSEVTITNGIISGNSTLDVGLGGGIMAEGGIVTVSGGHITNNRMAKFCGNDGWGCHGGGGLAANNGAHVTISGGQITGNYSEEAGGGVYVTNLNQSGRAWLNITGGNIASNVSYRSEGAGIRVGQKVDAMIGEASKDSPVYITNNRCMSRFDWGGGGIFVQGSNENASNAGRLFVYNSYISANTAGGYGGGVAVCPTGKTLVTNTKGTAIFGNSSAGEEHDDNHFDKEHVYNKEKNTGNEAKPHLSGGGEGKTEDKDAYESEVFRKHGHADFFLAAKKGHTDPIAAVIGKMLGGGDAKYSGSKECSDTKELSEPIDIPANGGVKIYRSVGLTSGVKAGSDAANKARDAATTFITGNYSWDHGGGIMSNGDLYLGQPADTYVYPCLKLKASKALKNKQTEDSMALAEGQFSFSVYRKDSGDATRPSWDDKTFSDGGCTLVGTAKNDASGNITFDLGEQFIDKTVEANKITYYLVEQTGGVSGIEYDHTVYEIEVQLSDSSTLLMNVPKKDNPNEDVPLYVHNYTITSVSAIEYSGDLPKPLGTMQEDSQGYYPIANSDRSKTFINTYTPYTPYTSKGSWTPKATKVVEGGEMKEFTLEFANDEQFEDIVSSESTKADGDNPQTLRFEKIEYTLDQLNKLESDSTGRGASKTFTYYVREQQPTTPLTNYKYDMSVYKLDVTMTDQKDGRITATKVTYTQIKDADGKPIDKGPVDYNDGSDTTKPKSTPTFTNTYSTSLPLSGMSGVTLTYLAGAAVLCAAAAWMHIRRKANAKGGERRE